MQRPFEAPNLPSEEFAALALEALERDNDPTVTLQTVKAVMAAQLRRELELNAGYP